MPLVHVQMFPYDFNLSSQEDGFRVGETVDFRDDTDRLVGKIEKTTNKLVGFPREPVTVLNIAITKGDLTQFTSLTSFAGLTVTGRTSGATAEIHAKCRVSMKARIFRRDKLDGMTVEALKLIDRAATLKNDEYVKQWFGNSVTTVQLSKIHLRMAALNQGAKILQHIHYLCATTEGLGSIDFRERSQYKPVSARVRLGRGFSYNRYSWGEKVCTIIHELTHWFIDTIDVEIDGVDAYGGECIKLAETATAEDNKALNNADNWAYYICQYRDAVSDDSWKYFTKSELAGRCSFDTDPKNVDTGLVQ